MRSFWTRSPITASAPETADSSASVTDKERSAGSAWAISSKPLIHARGPHSHTSAPACVSDQIFERATREWRMSPTIAILRRRTAFAPHTPGTAKGEQVEQCLGRMGVPAVAGVDHVAAEVACRDPTGAPARWWRTTSVVKPIASRLRTVSVSVSPLVIDEDGGSSRYVWAPSRRAAISNDNRVRVEGSANSMATCWSLMRAPASSPRSSCARKSVATPKSVSSSCMDMFSTSSRCLADQFTTPPPPFELTPADAR